MPPTLQLNSGMAGAGMATVCMLWLVGLAISAYWMVVAWRFMRAHERMADATERIAASQAPPPATPKFFGP